MIELEWHTVLVVDDDVDSRTMLARALASRGYDAVESPEITAVTMAKALKPGLILVSVAPERTAMLAHELRALPPLHKAFIVAMHDGAGMPPPGTPVDEYMHKPATEVEVIAAFERKRS